MAGSIATYVLNPYQKSVWQKQQDLQKKQNALDFLQIQQDEAAYKASAQQAKDAANLGWGRYQTGYGTDVTNLTNSTNNQALQMGNARGSWARDEIAGGAQRKALDTGLAQAQQDWQRNLSDIDYQAQQNALGIANRMTGYNLGLEQQANSDWAATHYYKAPAVAAPKPPPDPALPTNPATLYLHPASTYQQTIPTSYGISPTVQISTAKKKTTPNYTNPYAMYQGVKTGAYGY